jgi:hypothetical protein
MKEKKKIKKNAMDRVRREQHDDVMNRVFP